jgi:hypothetical protein
MVTVAQHEANAENALLSTGPRTPIGKQLVAKNAITHGIFAKVPVVMGAGRDGVGHIPIWFRGVDHRRGSCQGNAS